MSKVIKSLYAMATSPYVIANNVPTLKYEQNESSSSPEDLVKQEMENLQQETLKQVNQSIQLAKLEAEQIIESANVESENMRSQGYEEGYAKGYEQGLSEGKQEAQIFIKEAQAILSEAYRIQEQMVRSIEPQVIDLVITTVKKIVPLESTSSDLVMYTVKNALSKISKQEHLIIKVNPLDFETLNKAKNSLVNWEFTPQIVINEDYLIEPGGCIIETQFGNVDARINSQLDEMERALKGVANDG